MIISFPNKNVLVRVVIGKTLNVTCYHLITVLAVAQLTAAGQPAQPCPALTQHILVTTQTYLTTALPTVMVTGVVTVVVTVS